MINLTNTLLDILLPPLCVACKQEAFFICANCREAIYEHKYFICPVCKRRDVSGRLDQQCRKETGLSRFLGAPLSYKDEPVRKIIHAFKYRRVKALAEPLAEILIDFLDHAHAPMGQIITPVPLNSFRERERGFNQAAEIARIVAAYYRLYFQERLLAKIKNTSNQADVKNKEKRIKNIEGAFSCRKPELVKGKIIILIDDIYTSGATMRECAKVLRKAGAKEVWGMAVARG